MSVLASANVWKHSKQTLASHLVMMLALADFADDDGRSYPSIAALARKCRTTPRHANRIIAALVDSGELQVRLNAGPAGTNRYRIVLEGLTPKSPHDLRVTPDTQVTLTLTSGTPDTQVPKPLTSRSDEPSLNRQEPSDRSLTRQRRLPDCPYEEIVAAYHEALPELPRVKLIDAKGRRKKLLEFWTFVFTSRKSDGLPRAATSEEAMGWVRQYFRRARSNDFVMGRVQRSHDHQNWEAGIDYLVSEAGRIQVIEKTKEAA